MWMSWKAFALNGQRLYLRALDTSVRRGGQTLVCVTLNDREDWQDHAALLDYGFAAYPRQVLVEKGTVLGQIPVEGSLLPLLPVRARSAAAYPVREGECVAVETDLPERVQAPVRAGEIAGSVRVLVQGKPVCEEYLIWGTGAGRDVVSSDERSWPWSWLKRPDKPQDPPSQSHSGAERQGNRSQVDGQADG